MQMKMTIKKERRRKKTIRNYKANTIALLPRNKHLTLSFIRIIGSLMVTIEIDLFSSPKLCSQKRIGAELFSLFLFLFLPLWRNLPGCSWKFIVDRQSSASSLFFFCCCCCCQQNTIGYRTPRKREVEKEIL